MTETLKPCECSGWAIYGPESHGKHHHTRCPKYETEKHPYLMYYDEGIDAWTFATTDIECIVGDPGDLGIGEVREVLFKRVDMTDAEVDALPED